MKCKNCGNEMTLYQSSWHTHFGENRYRCDVCGWEDMEEFGRENKRNKKEDEE
jgi:ribosomal protein S27E